MVFSMDSLSEEYVSKDVITGIPRRSRGYVPENDRERRD